MLYMIYTLPNDKDKYIKIIQAKGNLVQCVLPHAIQSYRNPMTHGTEEVQPFFPEGDHLRSSLRAISTRATVGVARFG